MVAWLTFMLNPMVIGFGNNNGKLASENGDKARSLLHIAPFHSFDLEINVMEYLLNQPTPLVVFPN